MTEQRLAFMDEGVLDDPAPYYQELLGQPPFQDKETGLWVVSRDADVRDALLNSEDFANRLTLFPHYPLCDEAMQVLGQLQSVPATTAGGDGEVHARARAAIRATFPTSVSRAQRNMGQIVHEAVDDLATALPRREQERGTVDLVHDFGWELPLRVNMRILGFPDDMYDKVKEWSVGQIALTWGKLDPAGQIQAAQGLVGLWQTCQSMVSVRRAMQANHLELTDDMTSRLLLDGRLSDDEVASVILNFAVAGHETTANAIGDASLHLLSQPGAWEELAQRSDDPSYVSGVVERELALNPPIIGWSRVTNRLVEVSGVTIPADQRVLLLLGAANIDQHRMKQANDHVSFGLGLHYCVGAPLARLEMADALSTLARRYPDMQLQPEFAKKPGKFHANLGFRALRSLPVVLYP
ncbi:MAG TPA: cytochrome P450 [Candidatus Saccharimonadales bacterium]|nr:cytochrome P450 [Candidatus Saccharimonadales bacterium]